MQEWTSGVMTLSAPVLPCWEEEELKRLDEIAEDLAANDPLFDEERETYAALFPTALPKEPPFSLLIDDFSIIAHLHLVRGLAYYASRAFTRAQQGDLVAGTFAPIPGIEDYLDTRLGLGRCEYLQIEPAEGKPTYACFAGLREDEEALRVLLQRMADNDNSVWFHPYMGLRDAWECGLMLKERSGGDVQILAPLPYITEQTNDKVWLTEVTKLALGESYAMRAAGARSVSEAVAKLRAIAEGVEKVSLKLANSATGMGTGIFEAAKIREMDSETLLAFVEDWCKEKEWDADHDPPLSVEVWETDVLASPSTQLWIPPVSEGPPVLEGVFDQLFQPDEEHVFLGSIKSQLPQPLQDELAQTSLKLGRIFQRLGYLGRCSFDTIYCGTSLDDVTLKYVECNGRWGGTSTPMTLMTRLFGDFRARPYLAGSMHSERLVGVSFDDFVRTLDDILYDVETGDGWAVVYNVGCLAPSGKIDVITLGEDLAQASERQTTFVELVTERFGV